MKTLFVLYSELAPYFVACLREFVRDGGIEVHVVRWPIHPDAPFQFPDEPGIHYYERKDLDVDGMIALGEKVNPDGVYVAGWIDRDYLKVARHFRKKGMPVIAAIDTQWLGTFRQQLAVMVSPFTILRVFTHCWVPGLYQFEYARRLGFPKFKIRTGMYAADTRIFTDGFEARMARKAQEYPKAIIYVGRLVEMKGGRELYKAFRELSDEQDHDWKLIFVGNGPLMEELAPTKNIEVIPFVQQSDLPGIADRGGAFILPSQYEAWGVAVHEFAAAGLPLLLSEAVGAATAFLRPSYNGFMHRANNVASIKTVIKRMMSLSDAELLEMGRRSNMLSQQISPASWSKTLNDILYPN